MTGALKTVMRIYGAVGAVIGVAYIAVPRQAADFEGWTGISEQRVATKEVLGVTFLAVGIFMVLASRDPLREMLWVKFGTVFALLFVGVAVHTGLVVYHDIGQALPGVLIHGAAFAGFAVCYPREALRQAQKTTLAAR